MEWKQQCFELWGERWKSTLALTAGVTKRTVQRWNSGENRIPLETVTNIEKTFNIWVNSEVLIRANSPQFKE